MTLKKSIILGFEPGPLFRSCTGNPRRTGCQGKGNGGEYGRGTLTPPLKERLVVFSQ